MNRVLLFLPLLAIVSCTKESATNYHAYLKNGTSRKITILPFKSGFVNGPDTIHLDPQQEIMIAEGSDRGMVNHGGFDHDRLSRNSQDSTVVIFDDTYRVAHYVDMPSQTTAKYIDYSSNRNLSNFKSYDYSYKDVNKHNREASYNYVFVSSDYEFARQ